jgi:hypothetical protein
MVSEVSKKIIRNMDTPESRAFWKHAEENAVDLEDWPAWKKGGINVSQSGLRAEPREIESKEEQMSDIDYERDYLLNSAKELAWKSLSKEQRAEFRKQAKEKWAKKQGRMVAKLSEEFKEWARKVKEDPDYTGFSRTPYLEDEDE